jgi:hypothetical protein
MICDTIRPEKDRNATVVCPEGGRGRQAGRQAGRQFLRSSRGELNVSMTCSRPGHPSGSCWDRAQS